MTTTSEKLKAQFPDLEYVKLVAPEDHPHYSYNGFNPSKVILPKGHVKSPGRKALTADVVYDRDVVITMRDGVKIYTDIFRPPSSDIEKVPALIPWSPYGKTGGGAQQYEIMGPFRCGVPLDSTSGYEKFEGPDPAEWSKRGYAIVNVDARGAGHSEGDIAFWGQQEAEDIYDTIDWLSKQPWCNGSVAMMGNSWLAIAQINFASRLSHPALKALAPWEALDDVYRDQVSRGGRPHNPGFSKLIMMGFAGSGSLENISEMRQKRPFYDDYWDNKKIKTENIKDVPLYLVASFSSKLHSKGSFDTFRKAKSAKKWLRVHPHQEWSDLYRPDINDDLQRYFDTYCKGIDNGWEKDTPPVRLSLLGFDGSPAKTVVERPEQEWPLARQELKKFYLDAATRTLLPQEISKPSSVSHAGHSLTESSDFTLYFDNATELAGYAMVRLYMSCAQKDDLDISVQIRKISSSGTPLEHLNYPCPVPASEVPNVNVAKALGPQGFLRASHVVSLNKSKSHDTEVFYTHDRREPITPGKIVAVDITLWPMGMVFAPGEGIMLRIAGFDTCYPETEMLTLKEPDDENVGEHVVHTGGEHGSFLVLPFI